MWIAKRYVAVLLVLLVQCTRQTVVGVVPNIVVILADDMGVDSVSALNPGMGMETPHLDQLAREGMSFCDAHSTSAVCSPTRYSVLTGRYNWRSRLKRGIVGKWERPLIESGRLTLAEMLRQKGYATACIGKWHLGWNWPKKGGGYTEQLHEIDFSKSVQGGPCNHGFDEYFGDDVPNWPPYIWRENDRLLGAVTGQMSAGAMVGVSAGPAAEAWDFRAVLHEYTKRWAGYVHAQADKDRPFFLLAALPSPHTPIAPHSEFQGRSGVSEYADFLLQTDHAVGEILRALKESKQAEDTIVFFTGDNGTSPKADFELLKRAGVHLDRNWRGWKADAYEGGHRVPFLVRWPGQVAGGAVREQTITVGDIMATCAEVVSFELPDNAAEDSVSLLPTLRGKEASQALHDVVVHHSISGHFAVRQGPWKLLLCRGSGGWSSPREPTAAKRSLPALQLYHLGDDPKESTNLQAMHPDLVQRLLKKLRRTVEQGRSTPGPRQPNHAREIWWSGLPWETPKETVLAPTN